MKLILEGPDNAGKTTLAQRVVAALGDRVIYRHPGGRPDDLQAELNCMNEQLWLLTNQPNIVHDRVTCISQQVYNSDVQLNEMRNLALRDLMSIPGLVIVYCRPPTDRLMAVEEFTWREGETEEHMQKIVRNQHKFIERYDALMQTVPCISYNYKEPSAEVIYQKIVQAMSGVIGSQAWFDELINYRSAS